MADLFEDYAGEHAALAPFYTAFPRALFERPAALGPWREDIAGAVRSLNEGLGLDCSLTGSEHCIITGQQPGLLTGPLYTVYKAITAIRVAELYQKRTGHPCVPLFWVSGDDHDFEEVRSAHILTRDHEQLTLRYAPELEEDLGLAVDGFPMHRVPISSSLHGCIDRAADAAHGSEYKEDVRVFLHQTLDSAISMADWFAVIMAGLFQDTPLLFFMPHLPTARKAAAEVIRQEIRHPLESTRLLNEAGQRLERLGYRPQVVKHANECNFFLEMGDRRRKVLFESGRFVLPEENITCSPDEMETLLDLLPHRFSPNVALRCVVQQALFPVAAYVGGPGEIAYWAQVRPLFEFFGQAMPIVYPRARAVIVSPKLNQLRARFGWSIDDCGRPEEDLVDQALRNVVKSSALDALRAQRGPTEAALRGFAEGVSAAAPAAHIKSMMDGWAEQSIEGMDRIERVLLHGDEARTEAVKRQVRRLRNSLAPDRKPQERVYSMVSFLFAQGPELIPRLMSSLDVESFAVNEVEL